MQQSHSELPQSTLKGLPWFDIFMSVLLASFLAAGVITGYLFYQSVRTFVATSNSPILPSIASLPRINMSAPISAQEEIDDVPAPTAIAGAGDDTTMDQPAPNLSGPMTILVMGIDKRRDEEFGAWRTDTMIVARIDPETHEASMLSVPRDLYVLLPDYGRGAHGSRINTANVYGEISDYPGGGPALAKRAIYKNFGIEVDRYVMIDFDGFRKIVDHIGGITVDVPRGIVDTRYPTEDYGYMRVEFESGVQHMDGDRALIYARTRHSSSDFARAERQQQVIMAIRDKALSLGILPSLTPANLVSLVDTVGNSVKTDLTLDEMWALAQVARDVEDGGISRGVVGPNYIRPIINSDGSEVLLPRWNEIMPLVEDELGFEVENGAPAIPLPPTPTPTPTGTITSTLSITPTLNVTPTP